jgi:hypothetical protein
MAPIARQLKGRVGFFRALGRHATWYVPTVIGLYNVYEASPDVRMRTLFAEGFGVVGGYLGTRFGSTAVASGAIGLFALCGICLGPLGIFVTIFICASTVGIVGNELFKWGGGKLYDTGVEFSGNIYHSMDELLGASY